MAAVIVALVLPPAMITEAVPRVDVCLLHHSFSPVPAMACPRASVSLLPVCGERGAREAPPCRRDPIDGPTRRGGVSHRRPGARASIGGP
jgi:hypothetical protein